MGVEAVWAANNHSCDLGEGGVVTTLDYLDAAGISHAGTGRNLSEATAPAYHDTAHGRMALISASDWGPRGKADLPYPIPHGVMAADQGAAFPDRPGLNLLRFDAPLHVDREALDALRRISAKLGWEETKERRRRGGGRDEPLVGPDLVGGEQDDDDAFHFMGTKFVAGDAFTFETVPYEADLERNYKWIAEARRQADVVVVGLHQQGASRSEREPPDHTRIFARGAIDAGADVFVAHGASASRTTGSISSSRSRTARARLSPSTGRHAPIFRSTSPRSGRAASRSQANGPPAGSGPPSFRSGPMFSSIPSAAGRRAPARSISDLDIQAGGRLRITDDVDETVAKLKPAMAFQLGGMGSATRNFYNDVFRRAGWEDEAREVQRLWLERRRAEAAAAVPDDLILKSSLIGSPDAVRERIRLCRAAGVTTLRLSPIGDTLAERLDQLGQALDLIDPH